MKFRSVDEIEQFSFDDSQIRELGFADGQMRFVLSGAMVRADNSQNSRFQDMYCGELVLTLTNARLARVVKEGLKYYDADGKLLREIPDEDVPEPGVARVLERCAGGTIFTVVKDDVESGSGAEFGIDVPREDDDDEVDTFWLCVLFDGVTAEWERYCSPVEEQDTARPF